MRVGISLGHNGSSRPSLGDRNAVPTMIANHTGRFRPLWNRENVKYGSAGSRSPKSETSPCRNPNGYGADGSVRPPHSGATSRTARSLHRLLRPGPAPSAHPIRYPAARKSRDDIATWMNIPETEIITLEKRDSTLPDVLIIIGKDFTVPGG